MKFQVSIVVPVYNVEKHLKQCIESIINQDMGFDAIELVLVNDGSKDNSGDICEHYAKKYPNNIIYVEQKNAGVSEARNIGIKNATGEYIGFVDADDYLSKNAVRGVMEYLKAAPEDVDMAIIRVIQFGYYTSERNINAKFDTGTRTLRLNAPEWHDVNARVAPSFIKSSVAKSHRFHKDIGIYEDTRYVSEILMKNMKLGVVSKGVYYNRIHNGRDTNASITTGATKERRFYTDSPQGVSLHLLRKSKGKSKYPPLYFQYVALYEMRWRLFYNSHNPKDILSEEEFSTYKRINNEILGLISDQAIIDFKLYSIDQCIFLLSLKHGIDIRRGAELNDNELIWGGVPILNYKEDMSIKITDAFLSRDELTLEGFFSAPLTEGVGVYLRVDGEEREDLIEYVDADKADEDTLLFNTDMRCGDSFRARIPIEHTAVQSVDFILRSNNVEYVLERLSIPSSFRYGYGFKGNYTLVKRAGRLMICPQTSHLIVKRLMAKKRYLVELIKRILRKARRICIQMIKTLK